MQQTCQVNSITVIKKNFKNWSRNQIFDFRNHSDKSKDGNKINANIVDDLDKTR